MLTKRDIKQLFRNDHKMSLLIDFLYRNDQIKYTDGELKLKIEGEWVKLTADLVASIPSRATPQQITHAEDVDAYIPPIGLAAIQVVCLNGEFGTETEYLFPTHVIYNKEIKNLIIVP